MYRWLGRSSMAYSSRPQKPVEANKTVDLGEVRATTSRNAWARVARVEGATAPTLTVTGAQATVSPNVSFAEVAAACGYAAALDTDTLERVSEWLEAPRLDGPRFARLATRPGSPKDLPRPSITPVDVKSRLMQHFAHQDGAT